MSDQILTFARLEREAGQCYKPAEGEKWPLQEWYDSVRETPIDRLAAGDLATACRQGVWLEKAVPAAIDLIERDPEAGDLYDGELLVSLNYIPVDFWRQHSTEADLLQHLVRRRPLPKCDDEVVNIIKELVQKIASAQGKSIWI